MPMIPNAIQPAQRWVAAIGAAPEDDDDLRLRKSLLVLCAFMFIAAGLAWGAMNLALGEVGAALIPLGYSLFSILVRERPA